ncbi:MAG: TonB family protein [bacterium]|nr:TonB family protein [bacterium]
MLLEEWGLHAAEKALLRPRIVDAPRPDYSDLVDAQVRVEPSVVVVTGEVTPLGTVKNTQLKITSGLETIDERCLEAFRRWRYRPARGKHGYMSSRVAASCHIYLK